MSSTNDHERFVQCYEELENDVDSTVINAIGIALFSSLLCFTLYIFIKYLIVTNKCR